jgi:hypothetical protein
MMGIGQHSAKCFSQPMRFAIEWKTRFFDCVTHKAAEAVHRERPTVLRV